MPPSSVRAPPRRLVVATSNPGKLREFRSLLEGIHVHGAPYELLSLADLGLVAPQETGSTFLANALLKAEHAATLSGYAALADDSGLEVDALHGAPGIYSARYAGGGQSAADVDAANNAKLLRELGDTPLEQRTARYQCALVLLDARLAAPLIAERAWDGYILAAPRGTGGFGYDPYFWLPDQQLTAAQLTPEQKNRLSHRGQAMRALHAALTTHAGQPLSEQPQRLSRRDD
jgi:XTP/dITP diphosphohydrolase